MLKQGKHKKKFIALPAVFMIAIVVAVFAISPNAKAAQYSADVNVDRERHRYGTDIGDDNKDYI